MNHKTLDKIYINFAIIILLASCSSQRSIEPLGEGKSALHFSVGGPGLIQSNIPIPTPDLSVDLVQGMSENTNLETGIHVSPLLMKVFVGNVGAFTQLMESSGYVPSFNLSYKLNVVSDSSLFVWVPEVSILSSYEMGDLHDLFFGPQYSYAFGHMDASSVWSLFAGYRYQASEAFSYGLELKWFMVNESFEYTKVGFWNAFNNRGRLGIYFDFSYKFGE